MRVSEDATGDQLRMCAHLRVGVHAASGVIEIHVLLRVQPRVLGAAQLVEPGRARVFGKALEQFTRRVRRGGWA